MVRRVKEAGRPRVSEPGVLAFVAGAHALARLMVIAPASPVVLPDSGDYQRMARDSLFSLHFFLDVKPWGTPLVYKLLPDPLTLSGPLAQLGISIACWLALAFAVRASLHGARMRWFGFAGVLVFSLSSWVTQWDAIVLSESLSLSLLALVLAAFLELLRRPNRWTVAAVIATSILWSGTRDTNVLLALGLLLVCSTALALRGSWRYSATLAAAGLAIALVTAWSTASPARSQVLLIDAVNERVLPNPQATAYFVKHGMPTWPGMRRELFASRRPIGRFEQSEQLAPFRHWLLASGKRTYTRYLLSHPRASIAEPLAHLSELVSPALAATYAPPKLRHPLPSVLEGSIFGVGGTTLLGWGALALAAMAAATYRRQGRTAWIVPASVLLLTPLHAILTWDGEPIEIARHAVAVGVSARLALLLAALMLADVLAPALAQRRKVAAPLTMQPVDEPPPT